MNRIPDFYYLFYDDYMDMRNDYNFARYRFNGLNLFAIKMDEILT